MGRYSVHTADHAKNIASTCECQFEMINPVNVLCKTYYMHHHNINRIPKKQTEDVSDYCECLGNLQARLYQCHSI